MKVTGIWPAVASATLAAVAHADIQRTVKDGGSIVTESGPISDRHTINEGSTLSRSWVTLDDTDCPVALVDAGVVVNGMGDRFGAVGSVHPRVPISAFEVRFVLLDIFGNVLATFSKVQIKDLDATTKTLLSEPRRQGMQVGADWKASWSEVRRLLTVVSFVAKVRTQDGLVWQYDAVAESILEIGFAPSALTGAPAEAGDD